MHSDPLRPAAACILDLRASMSIASDDNFRTPTLWKRWRAIAIRVDGRCDSATGRSSRNYPNTVRLPERTSRVTHEDQRRQSLQSGLRHVLRTGARPPCRASGWRNRMTGARRQQRAPSNSRRLTSTLEACPRQAFTPRKTTGRVGVCRRSTWTKGWQPLEVAHGKWRPRPFRRSRPRSSPHAVPRCAARWTTPAPSPGRCCGAAW